MGGKSTGKCTNAHSLWQMWLCICYEQYKSCILLQNIRNFTKSRKKTTFYDIVKMNSCKYNNKKKILNTCVNFFGGHNISNTLSKTTSSLKREASWGRNNKRRVMIKVLGDWMELKQKLRVLQMFLWSKAALGTQIISQGELKPN